MSEWQVFGVVAAIVTLFLAIGTPVIKLNSAVTTLNNQIKNLSDCINEMRSGNRDAHKRMWEKMNGLEAEVNELRQEITILKIKNGGEADDK